MRKILATAVLCLGFLTPAHSADLGGPKVPGTVIAAEQPSQRPWNGAYLEASGTMFNVQVAGLGSTIGMAGIGAGYDYRLSNHFVIGAFARYDLSLEDMDNRSLSLGARLGYLINPHLLLYAPVAYTIDGKDFSFKDGIWSAGLGLETYFLGTNTTIFAEMTKDISMSGGARFLDEATTARAGFKLRF